MYKKIFIPLMIIILFVMTSGLVVAEWSEDDWEYHDFGGETVVIEKANWPHGILRDLENSPEAQVWVKKVEDAYNVNLEFVNYIGDEAPSSTNAPQDYVEWLAPLIMSDSLEAKVIQVAHDSWGYMAEKEGLIHSLNDYLTDDYWDAINPEMDPGRYRSPLTGNYVNFSQGDRGIKRYRGEYLVYNKEIFEKYNLQDPYELWKAGEWNWDNFMDLVEAATIDEDGDGEIDIYGIGYSAHWKRAEYVKLFLEMNNAPAVVQEDGELKYALDREPAVEALSFMQELFVETEGATDGQDDFNPIDGFAEEHNVAMMFYEWWRLKRITQYGDDVPDFRIVPLPMGPNSDEYKIGLDGAGSGWSYAIPITTENPERYISLVSMLVRAPRQFAETPLENEKEEVYKDDTNHFRDRESLEVHEWLLERPTVVLYHSDLYVPGLADIANDLGIRSDEMNDPASYLNEIANSKQAYLDDYFNN